MFREQPVEKLEHIAMLKDQPQNLRTTTSRTDEYRCEDNAYDRAFCGGKMYEHQRREYTNDNDRDIILDTSTKSTNDPNHFIVILPIFFTRFVLETLITLATSLKSPCVLVNLK